MSGFFSKIFGGNKPEGRLSDPVLAVTQTVEGLIQKSGFDVEFKVTVTSENSIAVEFKGTDEALLLDKEGMVLDAIELFLLRVLQHRFQNEKIDVSVDCGNFRRESNRALEEIADQLRQKVLNNNKSVYYRALSPKERKVIHQYLANDARIRSRSVGDGLYKRIKVYPAPAVEAEN